MNSNIGIDPGLQRIIEAHPLLFRGRAPVVPSYVMAGWHALIDKLCSDIESALGPKTCAEFEVRQIKEKFGTLRFYYRLGARMGLHIDVMSSRGRQYFVGQQSRAEVPDIYEARVRTLVDAACAASTSACERCGEPAQLRDLGGYLTTLCEQHLADMMAKRSRRSS
jgi:hypothetical protein